MSNEKKESTFFTDYQKLIKEVGAVEKAGINDFFSKGDKVSKHMTLADVLIAVKNACVECNFIFLQRVSGKTLHTTLKHTSGETLESEMDLLLPSNDMQKYGSAITYARRYSLVTMLGISDKDDDGNDAMKQPDKPKPKKLEEFAEHEQATIAKWKEDINAETEQKALANLMKSQRAKDLQKAYPEVHSFVIAMGKKQYKALELPT